MKIKSIVLFFLVLSCLSVKQNNNNEIYNIINNEIEFASSFSNNNKIIIYLNQNQYLIDFLKQVKANDFEKIKQLDLEKDVMSSYFNKSNINYVLMEAKNQKSISLKKIKLSKDQQVVTSKKITTKEFLKNASVYKIYLSKPLMSQSKNFAVISYSRGFDNSLEGGIAIYRKSKYNWERLNVLDGWIE
ncbi:hypothetical protein [Olleya sp. Bg11-27]|uniref:hypothetical protein n=1 Tax=Olleya sp. Bg11-27 TaxID=2058135 RepID=UPI000C30F59C|nr:hypothetical protein [Olleya sp. Bg11-27]AUC74271.1 hypothetical protein CW732_00685 [Olleya sp. Bg11-27]